jgi:hypothetical protein
MTESEKKEEIKLDSIVTSVIQKFEQRAIFGKKKYGTDLDRTDLKTEDWITHAQEEFMDGILYLEKLKQCVQKQNQDGQLKKSESGNNIETFTSYWGC